MSDVTQICVARDGLVIRGEVHLEALMIPIALIRRSLLTACIGALAAIGGTFPAAAAQRPPALTGTQILARMQTAMAASGSVHLAIKTAHLANPGRSQTLQRILTGSGDMSLRDFQTHILTVSSVVSIQNARVLVTNRQEYVGVQTETASRTNRGTWTCQSIPSDQLRQAYDVSFYPLPMHPRRVVNVGRGMVGNVPVWRLRVGAGSDVTMAGTVVILSVAQDTYRLVRETYLNGSKVAPDGQQKVIVTYSHFGEPVTVSLPTSCQHRLAKRGIA